MQVQWYHLEELGCVDSFQAESDEILKLQVLQVLREVGPGELLAVDQVDEDVEGCFDVVSSRLVKATARVQRCKHEVATEATHLTLLNMLPRIITVF